MDIVKFDPVRDEVLETLNWAAIFTLNMQKHALAIFLYDKKNSCLKGMWHQSF
jgi:hypothetical protein